MTTFGFVRAAAAVPVGRVADCAFNLAQHLLLLERARNEAADLVVFPELSLTSYTCADLFHQTALQTAAREALADLADRSREVFEGIIIVGLPIVADDQLYNAAAVLHQGKILGLVPKTFLPNYSEFYEHRWFAPGLRCRPGTAAIGARQVPISTGLLFDASAQVPGLVVGVEICEDLWAPVPPSSFQAMEGATLLVNLSASNEFIGKAGWRRQLVENQSGRCIAGYVYTSCGVHESTTDLVFGGHALIAENGALVAESVRYQREPQLVVADLDLERLHSDRLRNVTFGDSRFQRTPNEYQKVPISLPAPPRPRRLKRRVDAHPFVPRGQHQLNERCQEIFQTQVAGLAKRLEHIGKPKVALGVSGGLDSTLALLVACKTLDLLDLPRKHLLGVTMPGFGTTSRTRDNALALMRHLGVDSQEIDIRFLCFEEMRELGHRPFGIDLTGLTVEEFSRRLHLLPTEDRQDLVFENVQARRRTSLLMNRAFVIGTGDLSELALGWCTYNADHMSMYNPNVSIPKTLVKFLVRWAAENEFEGEARTTLLDIVATRISPELLPVGKNGEIVQATEETIGPYELHDFFLFHFLRYGAGPAKILYLADHAEFEREYTPEQIRHWLGVFIRRFFANQFKRSCLPDGPKVGSISLTPRGDWRMPSDAQAAIWLEELKSVSSDSHS